MGGVFLKRLIQFVLFCCFLCGLVWFGSVLADRKKLNEDVIRFHVVANSDSKEDQALKLQIKDAVTTKLQEVMKSLPDAKTAKQWIGDTLQELESYVNQLLSQIGAAQTAKVSLRQEEFDTREYETFSLPAGVYESLRITIGEGEGKNWWCVVFPTLCAPATTEGFSDTAAGSGFPNSLTGALERNRGYEIRFFFLDCLGRIENFFRRS